MSCADLHPYLRALAALAAVGVMVDLFFLTMRAAGALALDSPGALAHAVLDVLALVFSAAVLSGAVPDLLGLFGWSCGGSPEAPADLAGMIGILGRGLFRLLSTLFLISGALALLAGAGRAAAAWLSGSGGGAAGAVSWAVAGLVLAVSGALIRAFTEWFAVQIARALIP
jgi:hypothetical protein